MNLALNGLLKFWRKKPVETTKAKRDAFIEAGSEIASDLLKIFPNNPAIVIADIGACDGLSTIIYSRLFPRATFLCFEPLKSNYEKMMNNFEEYGILNRASCYNVALSNKIGAQKFYVSFGEAPGITDWDTGNKSSSLLPPDQHKKIHSWCKFKHTVVETIPLDSYGFTRIDFAHIDVQGAEQKVLLGGRDILRNSTALWIEVANVPIYTGQPMKKDLADYLSKTHKVIKDTCRNGRFGDILCLKKF